MIKKTRNTLLPFLLAAALLFTGCAHQATPDSTGKTTITDASGTAIMIPAKIQRIADSWAAHNEVLCLLGAGDKIVATTAAAKVPWLCKINPQFTKATAVFGGNDTNIEELMKTKPDIVFMTGNGKNASQLTSMGIPTIQLSFNDFASLKECVKLTGTILGSKSSQRADQYIAYLDEKINLITTVTADIPPSQRPRVIHVSSVKPLLVDGKNTIINAWIELAGGINAAETTANTPEVSLEQIVKWNPDIIIIGNTALTGKDGPISLSAILQDKAWQRVSAVQKGAVYINPEGAFYWDRYGVEEALQLQWAAKILYPDKFAHIDIIKETQYFYRTFFNYELSPEEAAKIIAGQPPTE